MELEVQKGDITNAKRIWNPASHRVLDTIYRGNTALVADSHASLQETIQRFAGSFVLLINPGKTVVMHFVLDAVIPFGRTIHWRSGQYSADRLRAPGMEVPIILLSQPHSCSLWIQHHPHL